MKNEQVHGSQPETVGTVGAQAESWRLNIADGSIFDQERALVCVLPASCVTSEWERRANLIAAAPDLLEALEVSRRHLYCKVTKRWLNPSEFDTSCDCVSCEDSRQINLAIAKASGR